jgi:NADPH:quinone reductase-like Zn-dependent oxidoreductase
VFLTAWDALVVQGGLTSGRWALVHAAASGVGTAAVQIVRSIGARVVATCSTKKVDAVRALGADVVVDYTSEDFVQAVATATGGRGVDVILDVIGGDYLDRNVASIALKGRIVQVGVMGGGKVEFNLGALMPKRASLTGTVLRARPLEEKIALAQRFSAEMLPLFESGHMKPVITRSDRRRASAHGSQRERRQDPDRRRELALRDRHVGSLVDPGVPLAWAADLLFLVLQQL